MASPAPGLKRMNIDVVKLVQKRYDVTYLNGANEIMVKFYGPKDTPYEGGIWNIRVEIPDNYPFKSPSIGFMNRIYHPNIDEMSGTICLDVINQHWSPISDLTNIFDYFLPQLLTYPNTSDPLNIEAAKLHDSKPYDYQKRVKDYVQKFATGKILKSLRKNYDDFDDTSSSELSEPEENK